MSLFVPAKLLLLSAALLGVARSSALPATNLFSRQSTTPDGTCGIIESGSGRGYRCPTDSSKCCSQWGWCGDSTDYCGTGCQAAYGSCTGTGGGGGTTPPPTGGRPRPGSVPYGQIISSCTQNGVVALTFDDGPYIYTPGLLDILSRNGVHATFFINGQNWGDPITSSANQAVLQRMIAEGHQIGSHTWAHPSLDTLSPADITSQMTQIETALVNIIGKYPTYMRPPYFECGSTCLSTMDTLSYHVIYTNLDTMDWANTANIQPSKDIFYNAITNSNTASSNFIVLSHDVHQTTVNELVQYEIDTLKAKGYRTVTVGECLGDPAANWYRT